MPNVNFDILKSIVAFEKTRQDQTTVTSNQDQSKAARQPNKNYISDVMNDLNIMLFPKGSNNNDQGLYQLKEKILAVDLDNVRWVV